MSSSGVVTARAKGTATITATAKGGAVSRTCTVTVEEVNVTGVTVSPSSLTLKEGESRPLTATVRRSGCGQRHHHRLDHQRTDRYLPRHRGGLSERQLGGTSAES